MSSEVCHQCGQPFAAMLKPHVRVIVPLYNSSSHLPKLRDFLEELGNRIPGGIAVTLVVDGLRHDEEAAQHALETWPIDVRVICLSRNFGVGPALHAGMTVSSECVVTALGSDLQEPVELFVEFAELISSGVAEVALGVRRSRADPLVARTMSNVYWRAHRRFIDSSTPLGGFDVFAVSRRACQSIVGMDELNTSFTSQTLWIGYKRVMVPFDRRMRIEGKSNWSFRAKFRLMADSFYGFTSLPITIMTIAGLAASLFFLLLAIGTAIAQVFGLIEVPGYATIVVLLASGQCLTFFGLGIVGGYVYRTFENSTNRPKFIIRHDSEST